MEYRLQLESRPRQAKDGDVFALPRRLADKNDERFLALQLIFNRPLFGEAYSYLMPDYFYEMPSGSGVMIGAFIPTPNIFEGVRFPGDIDLLIIPYEGDDLVLSRTLAIEVKAVRASYEKQNRSPNTFGFSQAKALIDLGLPHVAVAHLIVSDESPMEAWRDALVVKIIDADAGTCEEPRSVKADLMPVDLIRRSFGRLLSACPDSKIGLLSAYIKENRRWSPDGKAAQRNEKASHAVMKSLGDFYNRNSGDFIDTRRY